MIKIIMDKGCLENGNTKVCLYQLGKVYVNKQGQLERTGEVSGVKLKNLMNGQKAWHPMQHH